MEKNKKLQSTTDYGRVAWLIEIKGIQDIRNEMKILKKGKGLFFFELTDQEWFELKKEYDLSPYCDFTKRMARLKDLTF